jgi:HlyD family secretion protein
MKLRPQIAVPVVLALVVAGTLGYKSWQAQRTRGEIAASGTVEATEAQLSFKIGGRIARIAVREGDRVAAGAELARLEGVEIEARRAEAAAQVAAVRAGLAELEAGNRPEEIAQAAATRAAAAERLKDAARDRDRAERLLAEGAVSQEAFDKAAMAYTLAAREDERTAEGLRLMRAGARPERIAAQRAQLAQAEAALRAIDAEIDNLTLTSAFDGVVTVRHAEPGEVVGPGTPVLTVTNLDDRWVRIFVREDRLGAVHRGQPARITADTYPGKSYAGSVTYIASEAEFTPKTVQTSEERVRLVYALKVRITGDPDHELKPGLPADVRLDLRPGAASDSAPAPGAP